MRRVPHKHAAQPCFAGVGAGVLTSQLEGRVCCHAPQPDRRSHASPVGLPVEDLRRSRAFVQSPRGVRRRARPVLLWEAARRRPGLDMQVRARLTHRSGPARHATSVQSEAPDRDGAVVNQRIRSVTPTSRVRVTRHYQDVGGDRRIDVMRAGSLDTPSSET